MNESGAITVPVEGGSLRARIAEQFARVAQEQGKALPPLSEDLVLTDTDFDSLCFAIIVARLEDALGYDPFGLAEDAQFPLTFGDFVAFYEAGGALCADAPE